MDKHPDLYSIADSIANLVSFLDSDEEILRVASYFFDVSIYSDLTKKELCDITRVWSLELNQLGFRPLG